MWVYHDAQFAYEAVYDDIAEAWTGHKFFAYDLIAYKKPRTIVELGTYKGTSLWSFAQAVQDLHVDARIYCVDTWSGDVHMGQYGDAVFDMVRRIRHDYYNRVPITFLRMTFDEAAKDFADGSIDLLHIDGTHTYEAVKNDFVTWLPKMKKTGIILMHDIMVTRDDFGVYRLWREITQRYTTMEFHHSYGLGVVFLNAHDPMCASRDDMIRHYSFFTEDKERAYFARAQQRIASLHETVAAYDARLLSQRQEHERSVRALRLQTDRAERELQRTRRMLHDKDREAQRLNAEIATMQSSKFWKLREWNEKMKFGIFHPIACWRKHVISKL